MTTVRLFDSDVLCVEFEARVIERRDLNGQTGVILDKTCFYPASGGQPCDTGLLGGEKVLDVLEEGDVIVHVLECEMEKDVVEGRIDWERRFDHMQQHSGQHVLSQAFVQAADAGTIAFHLSDNYGTIDLDKVVDEEAVNRAESIANRAVWENRDVHARFIPRADIDQVPFRRPPQGEGDVRLVEIGGFDYAGCCGTHVRTTGEIGIIKVARWEKYKGGTRITFMCGKRALEDYQNKASVLRALTKRLTVGEEEILDSVSRLEEEKKSITKRMRELQSTAIAAEAEDLVVSAPVSRSVRIIKASFQSRDIEDVKILMKALMQHDNVVVLIGVTGERDTVFVGRSNDMNLDVRPILERMRTIIDGKGGGSPSFAQASSSDSGNVVTALDEAANMVMETIS